jgi:hypothetical protein
MYKMFNLDFSHNLFLPIAEEHVVFLRRPHEFPLEKRDVENGGVIVDELEEVDFEGQGVVEFGLSPQQCCRGDTIVPHVVLFLPFGTVVLHLNLLQILVHFN